MPRPLRLALVVVGLALVVYGTASLTGGWLGMPPWWPDEVEGPSLWQRQHPGRLGEGREWIGLSVIVLGLMVVIATWWPRPNSTGAASRLAASTPRVVWFFLGSVLAVYALASLTGVWLREPPWWRTRTAPSEFKQFRARQNEIERSNRPIARTPEARLANAQEREAFEEERARMNERRREVQVSRVDGSAYLRAGREWISVGVAALGFALAAFAAWSRRSRAGPPA